MEESIIMDGYRLYAGISKVMEISASESLMEIKGYNSNLFEIKTLSDAMVFEERVDGGYYEDVEDDWSTDRLETYFIKVPETTSKDDAEGLFERYLVYGYDQEGCKIYCGVDQLIKG